jgi:mRNA interferase RelE/StbE
MAMITYSKDALKTLRRIPSNVSRMIVAKIEQYAKDPQSLANNVTALQGYTHHYRLRVGDWRVLFTSEGEVIAIIKIAPRGGAYG